MTDEIIDLIIVGAGGLGREVYFWLSDFVEDQVRQQSRSKYRIKGFIDNHVKISDSVCSIIGSINDYQPSVNEMLVLAIMDPKVKSVIVKDLLRRGSKFFTLIHNSAIIGKDISMGMGCVICPKVTITANVKLGDFVFINIGSIIGHDVNIGNFTSINPNVSICGKSTIGEKTIIGASATVVPSRKVGARAFIGAGSVVVTNIKNDQKVFGNPAYPY